MKLCTAIHANVSHDKWEALSKAIACLKCRACNRAMLRRVCWRLGATGHAQQRRIIVIAE